jgi:hypothetical protein
MGFLGSPGSSVIRARLLGKFQWQEKVGSPNIDTVTNTNDLLDLSGEFSNRCYNVNKRGHEGFGRHSMDNCESVLPSVVFFVSLRFRSSIVRIVLLPDVFLLSNYELCYRRNLVPGYSYSYASGR